MLPSILCGGAPLAEHPRHLDLSIRSAAWLLQHDDTCPHGQPLYYGLYNRPKTQPTDDALGQEGFSFPSTHHRQADDCLTDDDFPLSALAWMTFPLPQLPHLGAFSGNPLELAMTRTVTFAGDQHGLLSNAAMRSNSRYNLSTFSVHQPLLSPLLISHQMTISSAMAPLPLP